MKENSNVTIWSMVALVFATVFLSILLFWPHLYRHQDADTLVAEDSSIELIDREEFDNLVAAKQNFVLLAGRVSCRQCAIVEYVLFQMNDKRVPVYILDLERYHGYDEYDEIKADLGINYVPTFFYFEKGESKYCMNNPLPDGYFDEDNTGEDRRALRLQTKKNISAFIDGITGEGEVVNEVPTPEMIVSEGTSSGIAAVRETASAGKE